MPTLFSTLRAASGLTQTEAATLFGVSINTVKKWENGSRGTPGPVIEDLANIVCDIVNSADDAVGLLQDQIDENGSNPESLHIGLCADDTEARILGHPTASAHRVSVAIAAADAISRGIEVEISYRGSTPETAAAVDAHDKVR